MQQDGDAPVEAEWLDVFTFNLDLGDAEMDMHIPLEFEITGGLDDYFDGQDPIVKPLIVLKDDLMAYTYPEFDIKLADGYVVADDNEYELAELADHLAEQDCALVIDLNNVVIVLFPARGDIANYDDPPAGPAIAFEVRLNDPEVNAGGTPKTKEDEDEDDEWEGLSDCSEDAFEDEPDLDSSDDIEDDQDDEIHISIAEQLFERIFDISLDDLLKWPTIPNMVSKNVFLLMDDDRNAEIEAFSSVLQLAGISVYTPDDEGSWEEFREQKSGVVIVSSQK